jgi:tetratricopeptide (TPR) repeat protein
MTDRKRETIEERLRHARRDLEELTTQLDDGEIDAVTADRLRERYTRDVADAERLLEEMPSSPRKPAGRPSGDAGPTPAKPATSGVSRRTLWIMGGAVVALTAVIIFLARSGDDAPETAAPDPVPSVGAPSDGGFAEMEAAVAAEPNNFSLRLALAGLYFELGEYLPAMQHYLAVAEGEGASAQDRSVALGRVGFMAYVTEQYDAAVLYIEQGIAADPENGENFLFMGVVQLYGLGDADTAAMNFEAVLALPDCTEANVSPCIPPELRVDVEGMLAEATATGGNG